jgi:uncharacterized protein YuzE
MTMNVNYDPRTDTLTVILRPGQVVESDEGKPGVILDFDGEGNLVGLEVLDASKRVADPRRVEFEVAS